jgi:hypothetical protein
MGMSELGGEGVAWSLNLALSGFDDAGAVGADETRLVLAYERVLDSHPAQTV